MSTVLGSVHAFSVFIPAWELSTSGTRASISFAYSLALICLTMAVLVGHHIFRRFSAPVIFTLVGIGSLAGMWLSANSTQVLSIYLTYGCLFGFANGLGYGYALQLAGQAADKRHAVSMSLVTAFYAVGAALAAQLFHQQIQLSGIESALRTGGLIIAIVCGVAAVACVVSRTSLRLEATGAAATQSNNKRLQIALWLLYGSSVTAGLMIIGHALPVFTARHPDVSNGALAPVMVALGNIIGGLSIGMAALRFRNRTLLLLFSGLSLAGLLLVVQTITSQVAITLTGLALIGFSYGAIIAVFPIVVTDTFGKLSAPRIYGQIFTAWGLAGLLAPTLSGMLFDRSGTYTLSITLALIICVLSIVVLTRLSDKQLSQTS
ncbi:MAG: MFS transporter [Pseudomonadota bacterium]